MKVAVFGATGIAGKAVVKEALAKGYEVTVLTRAASRVTEKNPKLKIVVGDVTNPKTIADVVKGQDAVIQTLGIGGRGNGKPTTFVSDTNKLIMSEMKKAGVERPIAISVIGAGDSWDYLPWIYRKFILPVFQKWLVPILADKNRMEPEIERSGLNWTIVRATTLTDKPGKGKCVATLDGKGIKSFSIPAADMAEFMVNQLTDKKYIDKTVTITGV